MYSLRHIIANIGLFSSLFFCPKRFWTDEYYEIDVIAIGTRACIACVLDYRLLDMIVRIRNAEFVLY